MAAPLETAVIIEALGTGVRFATFFVPASLGTLEGAYAAAFTAFGWAASDGLAFSLVRRGRQAVWIGDRAGRPGRHGSLPGERRVGRERGEAGRGEAGAGRLTGPSRDPVEREASLGLPSIATLHQGGGRLR